jgi:hypothetical protein
MSRKGVILLLNNSGIGKRRPVSAGLVHGLWDVQTSNLIRMFHQIDVKASRNVPGDVAVEWPNTRVVCYVLLFRWSAEENDTRARHLPRPRSHSA